MLVKSPLYFSDNYFHGLSLKCEVGSTVVIGFRPTSLAVVDLKQ